MYIFLYLTNLRIINMWTNALSVVQKINSKESDLSLLGDLIQCIRCLMNEFVFVIINDVKSYCNASPYVISASPSKLYFSLRDVESDLSNVASADFLWMKGHYCHPYSGLVNYSYVTWCLAYCARSVNVNHLFDSSARCFIPVVL